MSASQPELDREDEALKRAQRSHEASMDEILASIRAIIADDKANAGGNPARPAPAPNPQVIYSSFGQAKPAEPPTPAAAKAAASTPTVVWSRPDEEFTGDAVPEMAPAVAETPLLSAEADLAITASFQSLTASLATPSAERLDEIARETLRPMLKAWLDENLPSLVERLVKAEIERLARGGR
jgi:cell pole-organizing protein PopZ